MLNLLGKSASRRALGRALEQQLAARARAPVFFAHMGVPILLDGRFDLVALHALGGAELASSKADRTMPRRR